MKLRYHSIPRELFDALAAGGGGPAAIGALAAAEYSKHVLLLRGVSAAADATQAWFARTGWEVLTLTHEVQHVKLCAVLDIVRLTLPDDGRRYYAPCNACREQPAHG